MDRPAEEQTEAAIQAGANKLEIIAKEEGAKILSLESENDESGYDGWLK